MPWDGICQELRILLRATALECTVTIYDFQLKNDYLLIINSLHMFIPDNRRTREGERGDNFIRMMGCPAIEIFVFRNRSDLATGQFSLLFRLQHSHFIDVT